MLKTSWPRWPPHFHNFHILTYSLLQTKSHSEHLVRNGVHKWYFLKNSFWADYLKKTIFKNKLEDTTRYTGLLLAPAEGFGRGLFFALQAKKGLFMLFWAVFGDFWCPVVTVVTFSSNLSNFERNPPKNEKIQNKSKKIQKNLKIKKSKKIPKIQKKSKKKNKKIK